MLINTKALYGKKLAAFDGDIGHVRDFYFDDEIWVVRYLVADTGSWLSGRLVLLSPHSFARLTQDANEFQINLTRAQIEASPSIESDRPVSRQYEIDYCRYYGWPAYWNGGALWGAGAYPIVSPPASAEIRDQIMFRQRDDKHLRSTNAISGYTIQTAEGMIGEVCGLIVDGRNWAVNEVVVDIGHWYSGKTIMIPVGEILSISYEQSTVTTRLTKAQIERTLDHEMAHHGATSHAPINVKE